MWFQMMGVLSGEGGDESRCPTYLSDWHFFSFLSSRFEAEAAIVNYYRLDSTLSGHTDHSEKDLTKPLLSIR